MCQENYKKIIHWVIKYTQVFGENNKTIFDKKFMLTHLRTRIFVNIYYIWIQISSYYIGLRYRRSKTGFNSIIFNKSLGHIPKPVTAVQKKIILAIIIISVSCF